MLNSLLPFELDISELVFDVVFDWFEVLQVPGYFLDFISKTVDFLSVFWFGSDKFKLLLIFFFHFFLEFIEICIEDLIDAFLQFFQLIFEIYMEIGPVIGYLMFAFNLLFTNVDSIH